MINLVDLRAKVAAGQITVDEMLEIIASQDAAIQELEKIKQTKTDDLGQDLESLYNYLDQSCNENFEVNVIFDFFKFLVEKVESQTGYLADVTFLNSLWGYLPLEECFKALSVFRRKGTMAFPTRQECEKNTKITLPTGEKGLMGDFILTKLLEIKEIKDQENLAEVESKLKEDLESGELTPEEYVEKKRKVKKVTEVTDDL